METREMSVIFQIKNLKHWQFYHLYSYYSKNMHIKKYQVFFKSIFWCMSMKKIWLKCDTEPCINHSILGT